MKRIIIIIFAFLIVSSSFAYTYKVSNKGKEFIKSEEKLKLTAYWDSNGYSIGWGHHSKSVTKGMTISKAQAEKYFKSDIERVEKSVNRLLSKKALGYDYKFNQAFVDGFASFVFNCGESGAKSSLFYQTLKRCRIRKGVMNNNDYQFTLTKIKTSKISCVGHTKRRRGEYKLMLG